jgi:hypothetical protein
VLHPPQSRIEASSPGGNRSKAAIHGLFPLATGPLPATVPLISAYVDTRRSGQCVDGRFIANLKPPFKFSPHHRHRSEWEPVKTFARSLLKGDTREQGEADMARYEVADVEVGSLGEAPAGADSFYQLGMMYSIGRSVPVDLVAAHKWFNIAALRGNRDAIRLRREVADQMSEQDIAAAQRAARAWLTAH